MSLKMIPTPALWAASKILGKSTKPKMNHTDDELKKIALDLHKGLIFTDRHCHNQREVGQVFMVMMFMDEESRKGVQEIFMPDPESKRYGLVYEYIGDSAPRGVNGLPMFFSMKILSPDEADIVDKYHEKFEKAQKRVIG